MLRADAGVPAVERRGHVAPLCLGRQGGSLTCLGRARFRPELALRSGGHTTRIRLYGNETGTPTLSGRVLVSLISFGLAVTRMPRSCAVPHVRVLVAGQPGLTGIFAGCRWALCGAGCGCATVCRLFRRQFSRGRVALGSGLGSSDISQCAVLAITTWGALKVCSPAARRMPCSRSWHWLWSASHGLSWAVLLPRRLAFAQFRHLLQGSTGWRFLGPCWLLLPFGPSRRVSQLLILRPDELLPPTLPDLTWRATKRPKRG